MTMHALTRRSLLRTSALATGALALGPAFWKRAMAADPTFTDGPYGPLAAEPDANGFRLPKGFTSRVIARGGEPVGGTGYVLPIFPDGQATYALPDGGWILVTNSEVPGGSGGASAIRFTKDGEIAAAYRILEGTSANCSGGPTPWGTWLSGEEEDRGAIWECDPTQPSQGQRRAALGLFKHEAVAIDSVGQRLYLTEDHGDGGFYRFTPDLYPLLTSGLLEVASVGAGGAVAWLRVPNPTPGDDQPLVKDQVAGMTEFKRGEGIWFDSGIVYVATTSDGKVHAYDTRTERIEVIYDKAAFEQPPLTGVDNLTVSPSGDLFVCEDNSGEGGTLDVGLLTPDLTVSRFASVTGPEHLYDGPNPTPLPATSELTGPIFNPAGTRFYVCSQRARRAGAALPAGAVYEITGPFRLQRPSSGPASPGNPRTAEQAAREAGQAATSGQGDSLRTAPLIGTALGVEVPRRLSLARARRQGIPVLLTLTDAATVRASARARFKPAGRRVRRRRRYSLGRAQRRFSRPGPRQLRIRLPRRALTLLRGRRAPLRVVVEVQVGRDRVVRTVLLKP
jgi:secreted PhoX family phosphatase